jgi:hypothetical protein
MLLTSRLPPQLLHSLPRASTDGHDRVHGPLTTCRRADIQTSLSHQLDSPLPDFDLGQAISRSEVKVEEVRAALLQ